MTVARLVRELGPGEWQEWQGFELLEPDPDDWRTACIRATTMNAAGGKKGGFPFMAADFLPPPFDAPAGARAGAQTDAQMKGILTAVFGPPKPPGKA